MATTAGGFLGAFEDMASGDIDWGKILSTGAGAGIGALLGGSGSSRPTGYQGKVPVYSAIRQQVPMADQSPARRPGSGGRQYFTNTQYIPRSDESGIAAALGKAQQQSNAIAQANLAPTQGQRTALLNEAQSLYPMYTAPVAPPAPAEPEVKTEKNPEFSDDFVPAAPVGNASVSEAARGGLIGLATGGSTSEARFLAGGTDGMADKIPAVIDGGRPAKLGHGEFVIPADVVGFLGSGNSEAGAKVLYDMMDRIRKHAHGSKKQIKPANLKKTLPA